MMQPIKIGDVIDRGIPNRERIPLEVLQDFHLNAHWIGIGIKQQGNRIKPINDNMLWLGSGQVKAGDWIFVYTGKGEPRTTQIPNQNNQIYTVHWNRPNVLFQSEEVFPYLLDGLIYFPPSFEDTSEIDRLLLEALSKGQN